jgi:hypothetical protein
LDKNIVDRLKEVGEAWNPDLNRPQLPPQQPFIERPVLPVSASATSGNAANAIDGKNDRFYYSSWESSSSLPQSITFDFGEAVDGITTLNYVPKYKTVSTPTTLGSIKSYEIAVSTNNTDFTVVAAGEWNGDSSMKVATFTPITARYVRLEARSAANDYAAATEIEIGKEHSETAIKDRRGCTVPDAFVLEQNHPNPFNASTLISFTIPAASDIILTVFDLWGREVAMPVKGKRPAGTHFVAFDGMMLASGVYICRLQDGLRTNMKKMMLVK